MSWNKLVEKQYVDQQLDLLQFHRDLTAWGETHNGPNNHHTAILLSKYLPVRLSKECLSHGLIVIPLCRHITEHMGEQAKLQLLHIFWKSISVYRGTLDWDLQYARARTLGQILHTSSTCRAVVYDAVAETVPKELEKMKVSDMRMVVAMTIHCCLACIIVDKWQDRWDAMFPLFRTWFLRTKHLSINPAYKSLCKRVTGLIQQAAPPPLEGTRVTTSHELSQTPEGTRVEVHIPPDRSRRRGEIIVHQGVHFVYYYDGTVEPILARDGCTYYIAI